MFFYFKMIKSYAIYGYKQVCNLMPQHADFFTVLTVFYFSSCQQQTKNQPVFGYAEDSLAYHNLIAWDTLAPEARLEN